MLKVAITGNIASGKSQAEKILSDLGFAVYDSDNIAHSCLEKITDFYGYDVHKESRIDRKKLGALVFNNPELKEKLESIIHPMIREEILKIFDKNKDEKAVFISVPLLFEANFANLFDKIILITTDEKTRLNRLMERNNLTKEEALKRINSQADEKDKISKSDFVIENNSSIEKLEKDVNKVLSALL